MAISVKHPVVSGRKITPEDYAGEHLLTGTPGKWVKFGAGGALEETNAPTSGGGGSSIFINVKDYGAVGDGLTNDLPAFEAALAAAKLLASAQNPVLNKATPKVYVPTPAQHYYLAGSLNINICVHLFGDGSGAPNTSGTLLRFGDNCSGIIVNEYRTYGNGVGSVGDGSGSLIEGFTLYGGNVAVNASGVPTVFGDGTSSSGHGLWIRGTGVRAHDIQAFFWAESGVYIAADSGFGGAVEGNANNWRLQDIWSVYNDGSGVHVYGLDANAGTGVNVNAIQCRKAGILDQSFLGNTWIQPHVRDCGIISSTGLLLPTGMCSYPTSSTCYTVAWDKSVQASTTTPGTNSTIWIPMGGTHPNAKPWVSGMTWAVGAPYIVTNINARTSFINPYAESGQGLCQIAGSGLMLHGIMDIGDDAIAGIDGSGEGVHLKVGSGALTAPKFSARDTNSYIGGAAYFGIDGGSFTHTLTKHNANGRLLWSANNGGSGGAAFAVGTINDDFGVSFAAARLSVAGYLAATASDMGYGLNFISAPSEVVTGAKYVKAGSRFFNTATTDGAPESWVCTADGVPGSTGVFKASGIIGGVQAATVAAPTGGATIDTEARAQLAAVLTALKNAKLMAS